VGRLNFLPDKSSQPHVTLAKICAAFGVGESTGHHGHAAHEPDGPDVDAEELRRSEPAGVDGQGQWLLVDLREMPREVQVAAYEQGVIPYISADREVAPVSGSCRLTTPRRFFAAVVQTAEIGPKADGAERDCELRVRNLPCLISARTGTAISYVTGDDVNPPQSFRFLLVFGLRLTVFREKQVLDGDAAGNTKI
jgi:hypothetical protein